MADGSWGHGRPAETDTGLMQVLAAFVAQGGHLLGARRSPDNPLTLTHIRWQGTGGTMLDAVRQDPSVETTAEREVWVQLALHFPAAQPAPPGGETPWLPLSVTRESATPWVGLLRQDRAASRPYATVPPYNAGAVSGTYPVVGDSGYPRPPSSGYGSMPSRATFVPVPPTSVPPMSSSRQSGGSPYSAPYSMPAQTAGEQSQWTGAWERTTMDAPEVVVLPCVEIELPPQIDGASADYRRDFSRDVAMHFGRAARGISQVREVRGWMRGDRLVLAARFVIAMGNRPPARHEMDSAAQFLAEVLAQRTLPYTQLGFADPGEWMQGAPLPE